MLTRIAVPDRRVHVLALAVTVATVLMLTVPAMRQFSSSPASGSAISRLNFVGTDSAATRFEPNRGQTSQAVQYLAHTRGGTLLFKPAEIALVLRTPAAGTSPVAGSARSSDVVTLSFLGADSAALVAGAPLGSTVNYLIGNDPAAWHTDIPTYSAITYRGLYPGISLAFEGSAGQLKGTYTVAAGAKPAAIRWRYSGAKQVAVDHAGNLQIALPSGRITEQAPVAWQERDGGRVPVPATYAVAPDGAIRFTLGTYDRAAPLTIDPALTYSTYLGGTGDDSSNAVAADSLGNAYVIGQTVSADFPLLNPYQPSKAGGTDVFVSKFNAAGVLVFSTYLGGTGEDEGYGIAVDSADAIYVSGRTISTNFPTHNAYLATPAGNFDGFLSKLSNDGQILLYSTYLGGTASDVAWGVAAGAAGNAYVNGQTSSLNFPTRNAFQGTYAGGGDAFVTRIDTTAAGDSSLVYSTYLGGTLADYSGGAGISAIGHGIAADAGGHAYLAGATNSDNFPTHNAFQPARVQDFDAFATEIDTGAAGPASLLYSTYLGGTNYDAARDIGLDAAGNAYITGNAAFSNFPTRNAYGGCNAGPFVAKFNMALAGDASLVYSTCFGATVHGSAFGITVPGGNATITGSGGSGWPLVNQIMSFSGGVDAIVAKLNTTGNGLVYSTYLGGAGNDSGLGIAADGAGNTYVAGSTTSANYPAVNAYQATNHGATDGFVSKINEPAVAPTATPTVPPTPTTPPTQTSTPVPGDRPPVVTVPLNQPYRVGVEVGNYLALRVDASDPDAGDTVTFSVAGLPNGAAFPLPAAGNPIYSTLTWHPTASDIGTYYVTVTATDSHGASTSAVIRIDVVAGCVPYFADVYTTQYFYPAVQYLFCHYVVSGYIEPDQTFTYRPFNGTTRGQFSKMIAVAYALPAYNPPAPDFSDVPASNPFYPYIEAAFHAGIISGYADGTFHPFAPITRGQLSKLIVGAAGWAIDTTGGPHFVDVPPSNPFYNVVETAFHHNVISGYADGTFRPGAGATRGQIAKILWLALGSPGANP